MACNRCGFEYDGHFTSCPSITCSTCRGRLPKHHPYCPEIHPECRNEYERGAQFRWDDEIILSNLELSRLYSPAFQLGYRVTAWMLTSFDQEAEIVWDDEWES